MGSLMAGALANEGFETQLAESAVVAKRMLSSFDPDAVLVDIELGTGPNGIEFIQMLHRTRPYVAAILLSKHASPEDAGIASARVPENVAYIRKNLIHDANALVAALNEALQGMSRIRHDRDQSGSLAMLTRTQREILHLMACGFSNVEIARQRNTSLSSVEQRVTEIFKAFDIRRDESTAPRVEAVRRYIAEGGVPVR